MARRMAALIAGLLLIAAFAPSVTATTTRVECWTIGGTPPVETPGTVTWDGTVMHVRGLGWVMTSVSTCPQLTGRIEVAINYDLDVATGQGELWGTDQILPTAYPGSGFRSHFSGTFAGTMPPSWIGKGVGHGYGSLDGWQLREPLGNPPPAASVILFRPGS